jgi:hypothetical protein
VGTFKQAIVTLNVQGILSDLNNTRDSIDPAALGIPGARDNIAKARKDVQFDLSSLATSAADMNETLADVQSQRADVEQVDGAVDDLVVFLFEPQGLADSIRRLQGESLRSLAASQGTSAMLTEVARALDTSVASLNRIYAGLTLSSNASKLVDTSLEGELNSSSTLSTVDAVTSDRYSKHGPYHFLSALQASPDEPCPSDAFVCAVDPETTPTSGGGVFRNANGRLWDEDRKCITLQCINTQIDEWNKGPLSESADFSEALPLSVSRESATFLPFLVPLFMVLVAVMPLLYWKGDRWQRWPMCLSAWCIAACVPIAFALVGGLLFPLVIAGHDVCRGGG